MPAFASLAVRLGHVQVISGGSTAMRMHYNDGVFKAVRDSDWSAGHAAVHGVTLDTASPWTKCESRFSSVPTGPSPAGMARS